VLSFGSCLLDALKDASAASEPMQPQFEPERPGEVQRSCLDVSRARDELGWEPTVALRDGLRTILAGL